jgi:glycosyltransferase involved in cell wall biosynthesis
VKKISIGVLAYNEADSIATTLCSLFEQSIFQSATSGMEIEVIVVPNGCTDQTAEISRQELGKLVATTANRAVSVQVCQVQEAGKPNAWNLYVHQFSKPSVDYLFLMDADIQFLEPTTLSSMIETLEQNAQAWVSVDKLVKDVALKPNKNLMEKLSVAVSGVSGAKSVWICGQLYCGRAEVLRKIWMPKGVLVEDGFLWTMIVTDRFTSPEVLDRVVRADAASHVFEAYTQISSLLSHEVRQVVGNTINDTVYADLRSSHNSHKDAGATIALRNQEDPLWLDKLLATRIRHSGWWAVPSDLVLRRFIGITKKPLPKLVIFLPISILAFCVDFLVCIRANHQLQKLAQK